jgi:hypothetical protein
MEGRGQAGEGADAMTTKFTEAEAASILEQLESGAALTHEIAEEHECSPADIWRLWDERNRAR